ncbi:MAG: CHAD domain-containing protein [Nevskiales bacterium]
MNYALQAGQTLSENLRRIAGEQITLAHAALRAYPQDPEGVHEARKCLKRLRALLRLAREPLGESYAQKNVALRDLAHGLAGLRDLESLLELLPVLRKSAPKVLTRAGLARLREALHSSVLPPEKMQEQVEQTSTALQAAAERIAAWPTLPDDAETLVAGAARTYRSARRRMRDAFTEPSPDSFHEWRKQVKHHGYQLRVLQPLWPKFIGAQEKLMDELAEALGEEHDAGLLHQKLTGELGETLRPGSRLCWQTICAQFQDVRRERARLLGARAFAEGRGAFARRLTASYESWRAHDKPLPQWPATASSH